MQAVWHDNDEVGGPAMSEFDGDGIGGLEPTVEDLEEIQAELIKTPDSDRIVNFDPEEYDYHLNGQDDDRRVSYDEENDFDEEDNDWDDDGDEGSDGSYIVRY